jgi:hypothetical protein
VLITNGACFYIFGTQGSITGMPPVYMSLIGVDVVDGGLVWAFNFPMFSRIIWSASTVLISRRTTYFELVNALGPNSYGQWAYAVVWSTMTFTHSEFIMSGNYLGGSFMNGLFPLYFGNYYYLTNNSTWTLENSNFGEAFALHTHDPWYIEGNSVFWIRNLNMVCSRFCLSWNNDFNLQGQSVFILENCVASSSGDDVMFVYGYVYVSENSWFYAHQNHFATPRYAFSVYNSANIDTSAVMSYVDNSLLGTPWNVIVQTTNGGVATAQCNSLGGAVVTSLSQYVTAGITGLTDAYRCPRRGQCYDVRSTCFAAQTVLSSQCTCKCRAGGIPPLCTPSVPSPIIYPHHTSSVRLSDTTTVTTSLIGNGSTSLSVSGTLVASRTTEVTISSNQGTPSRTMSRSGTISMVTAGFSWSVSASSGFFRHGLSSSSSTSTTASQSRIISASRTSSLFCSASDAATASLTRTRPLTRPRAPPRRPIARTCRPHCTSPSMPLQCRARLPQQLWLFFLTAP